MSEIANSISKVSNNFGVILINEPDLKALKKVFFFFLYYYH